MQTSPNNSNLVPKSKALSIGMGAQCRTRNHWRVTWWSWRLKVIQPKYIDMGLSINGLPASHCQLSSSRLWLWVAPFADSFELINLNWNLDLRCGTNDYGQSDPISKWNNALRTLPNHCCLHMRFQYQPGSPQGNAENLEGLWVLASPTGSWNKTIGYFWPWVGIGCKTNHSHYCCYIVIST